MFDFSFDAVTIKAVVTLLILAATMYGFVSERLAPDVTALLALLALLLTGVDAIRSVLGIQPSGNDFRRGCAGIVCGLPWVDAPSRSQQSAPRFWAEEEYPATHRAAGRRGHHAPAARSPRLRYFMTGNISRQY